MGNKFGKLFKELSTNKVTCLKYDVNSNYYSFVQKMQKEGFCQCIVTSDIMINIMQRFVLKENTEISSIEFMVEDSELEEEIETIIGLMKQNAGYWEVLKQKISFLSQHDSVEMKKVNFRSLNGTGALFSVQVNGIIIVSENAFEDVSKCIIGIMEGCIK